MPKMSDCKPHNPNQECFFNFIKGRIAKPKLYYECKALFIRVGRKSYRIMSGQYLVFRDDGEILVMGPSSFHDVFKADAS